MQMIDSQDYHKEEINLPSNRSFGLTFFGVLFLISSISLIRRGELQSFHYILYSFSAIFLFFSFILSNLLTIPNRWWMAFGNLLHKIVSPVVMGVLFFGVVTPFAMVMRICGANLLDMKFENNKMSYWKEKDPQGPPPETMKNQF